MGNFEINLEPPKPPGGIVEIHGSGRGRSVVAIGVCLAVVIVLVVALGHSGDKNDKNIAEPTTTASAVDTTTTMVDASTTSLVGPTTTAGAVQVYGPLLPETTGVTLVLSQLDGHLLEVDVDSGTVTDLLPGQRLRNVFQMIPLRDGVVVSGDNGPRLVADGQISDVGVNIDAFIGTPDGIHLMGISYNEHGAQLVSLVPGGPRDAPIELPAESDALTVVPGSIVLQSRAGGVYQLDLTSYAVHKIAEGAFVAARGNRVASVTCGDDLQCRVGVGPFGKQPTHQAAAVPDVLDGFYGQGAPALSPTRDLLAYLTTLGGTAGLVVLDLDTGTDVLSLGLTAGARGGISPFGWSPDGRWLFWVDDGRVRAWSPDRGGDPIAFANAEAGAAQLIAMGY